MYFAGCDVGYQTAKATVLSGDDILASAVVPNRWSPVKAAEAAMEDSLDQAGISMTDIQYCVGTGYRKEIIHFVHQTESEITCHAKSAFWNTPTCRTVIDIGGQYTKFIRLNSEGDVTRYLYSDKCTIGTGRILEAVAAALEIDLSEMGELSETHSERLPLPHPLGMLAHDRALTLLDHGKAIPDIIHAFHTSLANRLAFLAKGLGTEEEIVITGGVAKNCGMFVSLAEALGSPVQTLYEMDPQLNGAVGASLLAREFYREMKNVA